MYLTAPKIDLGQISVTDKLADIRLPHDHTKWEDEILEALNEQHPYLPSGQLKLSINAKDPHTGYGIGNVMLNDKIQLPIVIDKFQLKPFDTFLKDGELQTLNKESVLAALQSNEFGTPVPPGAGEVSDVFMTHTRPPFDGKYTYAAAIDKFAAWTEATPEDVEKQLTNVFGVDNAEYFIGGDPTIKNVLDHLVAGNMDKIKEEGKTRVMNDTGTPVLKKNIGTPKTTGMKTSEWRTHIVPIADSKYEATRGGGAKLENAAQHKVAGLVFDDVYDIDLRKFAGCQMFVCGEGYDFNSAFFGEQTEDGRLAVIDKLAGDTLHIDQAQTGKTGVFWWRSDNGEKVACTSPVRITDRVMSRGHVYAVQGLGSTDKVAYIVPLASAGRPFHEKKGSYDVLYVPAGGFVEITPRRSPFGQSYDQNRNFVALSEQNGNYKVAFCVEAPLAIKIRKHFGATEQDGMTRSKVANLLGRFYDSESVEAALVSLRRAGTIKFATDGVEGYLKVAQHALGMSDREKEVISRIKLAAPTVLMAVMKMRQGLDVGADSASMMATAEKLAMIDPLAAVWYKVAAFIDEGEEQDTVDSALGLNILNSQTIAKYLDGIDMLETARKFCLKLLLASRLGLSIDGNAARTAAFALDDLVRELKQLRSMSTAGVEG